MSQYRNSSNIVRFRRKRKKPRVFLKYLSNRILQSLITIAAFLVLAAVVSMLNDQQFNDRLHKQGAIDDHYTEKITGVVVRIIDGDGIMVGNTEIRLGDFNAPELRQAGGGEAKDALYRIAYGKQVICTPCEGARNPNRCKSYDRIIATCRIQGERIGDIMRAKGIKEGGN